MLYINPCFSSNWNAIGLYMARDCRIYIYIRLVRINIRQYGLRIAYLSRLIIILDTKTAFRKFKYLELLPLKITFTL